MANAIVFTVEVSNSPGKLGELAQALADQKVNIKAFIALGMSGPSPVRFWVDSAAKAKRAFQKLGIPAKEEKVMLVTLADQPGTLASLGHKLGDASVNINWAYSTSAPGSKKQYVLLSVSNMKIAAKVAAGS